MAPLSRPRPRHRCRLELPLSRRGASAVVSAAKRVCKCIGASSMGLYQTKNPHPFYSGGGTLALAEGMLDVISLCGGPTLLPRCRRRRRCTVAVLPLPPQLPLPLISLSLLSLSSLPLPSLLPSLLLVDC